MQGLKTIVGTGQIVFGSDYPFGAGPGKHLTGLQKAGFNADELEAIRRGNALKILPRFAIEKAPLPESQFAPWQFELSIDNSCRIC